ncbi:hypothetical protein J4H86_06575 [Spiractinospora alimapuensis]|uniref:hypothetical protein n=1 Tax=Spiractinospora alimapuensis TaxID=2820884 RepID=UPI001F2B2A6B|nr:hypothetical protein [Spiractinospora alimapuensis]QVQ53418.1 hypothetical protein J4H86_06575 [Spiractinospora alimapuensis]
MRKAAHDSCGHGADSASKPSPGRPGAWLRRAGYFPITAGWEAFGYTDEQNRGGGASGYVRDDPGWVRAIGSLSYDLEGEETVHPPDDPDGEGTYEVGFDVNVQRHYSWDQEAADPFVGDRWFSGVLDLSESDLAESHGDTTQRREGAI